MSKKVWHKIAIHNKLTNEWEKVMEVKSKGLANLAINMLIKVYGQENVKEI